MKKTLALILALVMVAAILAGCSAKTAPAETTTASDTTATTETPAASTDSSATYTLKLGHDHTTTSPFQTCALAFKDQIEKESNGRITVEIYPAQSIGSSREMIEMMQMGTLEATLLPTAKFGGFDQRLNLADMPFLAETEEDFMAIMNGEIGREAMSGLEAIGIKGMAYFPEGYKSPTASTPSPVLTTSRVSKSVQWKRPSSCPCSRPGAQIRFLSISPKFITPCSRASLTVRRTHFCPSTICASMKCRTI